MSTSARAWRMLAAMSPAPLEPKALDAFNEQLAWWFGPRSEGRPYFLCYWEPGEPWSLVERYVVAECRTRALMGREVDFYRIMAPASPQAAREAVEESLFMQLEGRSPREDGHFDTCLGRYVHRSDPVTGEPMVPTITQRQWLLWRSHGVYARPAWIVQGSRGGTPRVYHEIQSQLERIKGRESTPASPGDLLYAPPDQRTLHAMMEHKYLCERLNDVGPDFLRRAQSRPETMTGAELTAYSAYESWFNDRLDNSL